MKRLFLGAAIALSSVFSFGGEAIAQSTEGCYEAPERSVYIGEVLPDTSLCTVDGMYIMYVRLPGVMQPEARIGMVVDGHDATIIVESLDGRWLRTDFTADGSYHWQGVEGLLYEYNNEFSAMVNVAATVRDM